MKSVLVHVLLTLVCSSEVGDSPLGWPQFLGPGGLSDAARQNPPLSFDLVRDVRFRVEVPAGSSSPCIVGDRLFLSGFEDGQLLMLAYDRRDGSELWRRQEEPLDQETFDHVDAHPAMPTPCSDGETVYFYFGSFGLIALDLDGRRRWELDLPRTINEFGVGNSPILFEDLLILNRDGCPEGAILALDKADGSLRYRIPRLGVFYSYSSPFLWRNAERSELIIAGTRKLCSYEPRTGKRLWQVHGTADFVCPTPTATPELLIHAAWTTASAGVRERADSFFGEMKLSDEETADGSLAFGRIDVNGDGRVEPRELPKSRALDSFAFIDLDGNGAWDIGEYTFIHDQEKFPGHNVMVAVEPGGLGNITDTHVKWRFNRGIPYVASPLVHDGRVYLVKAGGLLTVVDLETGKPAYRRTRLSDRSEYYATPLAVAGRILVCASGGTIYVLRADAELEIENEIELGERILATPAVVDDTLYLRSDRSLWAFGR